MEIHSFEILIVIAPITIALVRLLPTAIRTSHHFDWKYERRGRASKMRPLCVSHVNDQLDNGTAIGHDFYWKLPESNFHPTSSVCPTPACHLPDNSPRSNQSRLIMIIKNSFVAGSFRRNAHKFNVYCSINLIVGLSSGATARACL